MCKRTRKDHKQRPENPNKINQTIEMKKEREIENLSVTLIKIRVFTAAIGYFPNDIQIIYAVSTSYEVSTSYTQTVYTKVKQER